MSTMYRYFACLLGLFLFAFMAATAAAHGGVAARCVSQEQAEEEPGFGDCLSPSTYGNRASVADYTFVFHHHFNYGPSSYTLQVIGPSTFYEQVWRAGTYQKNKGQGFELLDENGIRIGWINRDEWKYFAVRSWIGPLTTSDIGMWTFKIFTNGNQTFSYSFEVMDVALTAESGTGQIGIVDQFVGQPLVMRLKSFDGSAAEFETIAWEITGPPNASFAWVTGPTQTDESGIWSGSVKLGTKPGIYTVTLSSPISHVEESFEFIAIDDVEDTNPEQEHPLVEQGVGQNSGQACDVAGNPVTLSIGNKFQREVDFEQAGLSPIEFIRYHNSLGFVSRSFTNYWTHTYDRYVEIPADPQSDLVRVVRPDGRKLNFSWNGTGYDSSPGIHASLEQVGGGWRFIDDEMTVETYDIDGYLIRIADLQGRVQTATFNASDLLQGIEDNLGGSLGFTYDSEDRLSTVTDQAGRIWTYKYETLGRLGFVDYPDGTTRTYHYEDLRHGYALTGITDERGTRYSTYEYDENGLAITSYHAGNVDRIDVEYDPNGDRIVMDPQGNTTVYQTRTEHKRGILDAISGPVCSQGCGLTDTEFTYDSGYNITSKVSYGVTTNYGDYDTKGQPGFIIEAAGTAGERRIEYEYDPRFFNRVTRITEPSVDPGEYKITDRSYDSAGNLTSETIAGFAPSGQPVARTTVNTYNGPFGQISSIDGPRTDANDLTQYEYYPNSSLQGANRARLKAVVDANGVRMRDNIQYSGTGKVISETRPNGVTITYQYFAGNDRLKALTESGGGSFKGSRWEYTPAGDVSMVILDDDSGQEVITRMFYDSARRLNRTESRVRRTPSGQGYAYDVDQWETYQFDNAGNVTTESHFSSDLPQEDIVIHRVFDEYQRLDAVTVGGITEDYDYNSDGTLAARTDGKLHTTAYTYDAFKRLTRTDQVGQVVTLQAYDVQGNLITVTDAENATTSYAFDDFGNLRQQTSPDTGSMSHSFNKAGQVTSSTDAKGQTTAFSYDPVGRLAAIDRLGIDYDVTYAYDNCANGTGRLCSVSTGWGHTVTYGRNALGDQTSVVSNEGQVSRTFGPAGNLTSIQYPSGRAVWFENDGGGLPTEIVLLVPGLPDITLVDNIKYSPMRRPVSWRANSGIQTNIDLDARQRPASINVQGIWNWSALSYDADDNLTALNLDGESQTYGYDALNRLVSSASPELSASFQYDKVGNRIAQTIDGQYETGSYEPQSNRIITLGNRNFALDANGNTVGLTISAGAQTSFAYSPHNRLLEVVDELNSTTVGSYQYDGLGQRVFKSSASGVRRFVYGLNGELLAELDGAGKALHEYVYLNGSLVADLYEIPAAPAPGGQIERVVDSNGLSVDIVGSNWQLKTHSAAMNGSYWHNRRFPDRYVRWYVDEGAFVGGNYDVFVKWLNPAGDGTQTAYRVLRLDDQGIGYWTTEYISHAGLSVGDWALLGNFEFKDTLPGGRYQGVYLRGNDNSPTQAGTFLEADAVKLVPTSGPLDLVDFRFVHTDHLGTPHLATNKNGEIVWMATYEPFGVATADDDPDGDSQAYSLNVRFPGQYEEVGTGLHYNYFRDYDPNLGRYLESDPMGLDAGTNTFSYAANNPILHIDSRGLAYFAFRPLGFFNGPDNCSAGGFTDEANIQLAHEQLFFEDGLTPSNLGFFQDGRVRRDNQENLGRYLCSGAKFNDCVMRKAVDITEAGDYCFVGIHGQNNCQDWAARVRANYSQLIKEPSVQKECKVCE